LPQYAEQFYASQRDDFKRLGVLGDWDNPYLTMAPAYQAAIVRALGKFVARGLVYKGKKPCTGACAIAPRSRKPRSSTSRIRRRRIYVEFPLSPERRGTLGSRVAALAGDPSASSSGRRRPGRFRRIWPSRFIRIRLRRV
jgi:isoleucyl-tRNA synthetase